MEYNKEIAILIGDAYGDLLQVLNDGGHDMYEQSSDMFPLRCLMALVKRATPLGVPAETDAKIKKIMDMIEPDELPELVNKPMPMVYRTNFIIAKGKALKR